MVKNGGYVGVNYETSKKNYLLEKKNWDIFIQLLQKKFLRLTVDLLPYDCIH